MSYMQLRVEVSLHLFGETPARQLKCRQNGQNTIIKRVFVETTSERLSTEV